jgi:alkaline phosphatase
VRPVKKSAALLCALVLLAAFAFPSAGLAKKKATATPKYVFLFIGDGMSTPQVTAAQYYLGSVNSPDDGTPRPAELSFTDFAYSGSATTYSLSSFCPDSASTATAMASGKKTLGGVLNYNYMLSRSFKLITEYAKEDGKKIGVVTSVSLNHATPAAFYAKVKSRYSYYQIGLQALTGDTVDYLGGGGFYDADGDDPDKPETSLYDVAVENGWNYSDTNEAIRGLNARSGRVLAVNPDLAENDSMAYEIDRERRAAEGEDILSLADFVSAGIRVLDNDDGFFMMCEGGKIDWACHANDAATTIKETLAFSDAVQVAVKFAKKHADETLIIVTADHETGGMSIGYATTGYRTYFGSLAAQTVSFEEFDRVIAALRTDSATFENALVKIEEDYGLTTEAGQVLSLTQDDLAALRAAFDLSMLPEEERTKTAEYTLLYGVYEPLSTAVSHIEYSKAGFGYTSYSHTGLPVPVYAQGVGAESFQGSYDNTDIFDKTLAAMGLSR